MEIISLTYKMTNIYLLKANCGWIMIDAGWPETLPQFLCLLKQNKVRIHDIKYLIITHFHPDHAGLTQDLKELGIKLILHETQVSSIEKFNAFFKKNPKVSFKNIQAGDNLIVSSDKSRHLLKDLGIDGVIIHTRGHSDDSISLIIDQCCAFTGDLPDFNYREAFFEQIIEDSWNAIQQHNIHKIYPAHGVPYNIDQQ